MSADITILGAGVMGLSMATECAARGASVQIIDPNGQPADHTCSWWAGGMLAPISEGVITEPEIVTHGKRAADWWTDQNVTVQRKGSLVVALDRDKAHLNTFARRAEGADALNKEVIAELEPDLSDTIDTGLYIEAEAHLNPREALGHLSDTLRARQIEIKLDGKATGQTIDCRGLAAQDALSDLRGVKGEMLVIRNLDITLRRPVRLLHSRHPLYIVPRGDGVFMLGATQIESGARDRASVRSVLELLSAAYALHPSFGEAEILEIGVDARPAFPDNQPRIRQTTDRIYLNGLFRHGFLLAPALAMMAADYVQDGKEPEDWYEDHR
ncbi:MAG: FAD-dependent oxidoreductase [Pseudomonadota bacterium]